MLHFKGQNMDDKQFLETWDIHNRINLYLLDDIDPAHLQDVAASKGRTVGEQFAHVHNVRLMWLKSAAPELLDKLDKVEKENAGDQKLLQKSLNDSSEAVKKLLKKSLETDGKIKGFKPHVAAFLGYLIAHESHHRGQIILSLKQSQHLPSKKVLFGLWEWGVR
jgi:uncharacterized damage-inducible protein DinB